MREAPGHVIRALKAYDRDLGMVWDVETAMWYFTHRGEKAFAYYHEDGCAAVNPVASEAVEIMRRADNNRDGGYAKLKAWERRRAERKYREEQERRLEMSEARGEAGERYDTWRRGAPKPFVHMANHAVPACAG